MSYSFVVLCFFFCLTIACQDGKDNSIAIHDLLNDAAKVRFHNVTVLTYDFDKKPICSKNGAAIKFPGFLSIAGGQIEITEPLSSVSNVVKLDFTTEHNSFFIGQVCFNGKSENAFVSDDLCHQNLCELVGQQTCELLKTKQTIDARALFDDYFPLPVSPVAEVGGEWRLEVKIKVQGKEVAHIRAGHSDEWIEILVDEETHEEL
ncbi:nucleoprotein [Aphelenchoides besseyi]|nr:nucleoprotein [Aphelenchoides besseyi]KAI6201281.1 nucleoprotein [Aphelenchoides besseyi]